MEDTRRNCEQESRRKVKGWPFRRELGRKREKGGSFEMGKELIMERKEEERVDPLATCREEIVENGLPCSRKQSRRSSTGFLQSMGEKEREREKL